MPKESNKKQNNKHFMKDFKAELKRVIWPTPKQLLKNTGAVISIVIIVAVLVFVLDFAFEKINQYGIEQIKSVVETKNTIDAETSNVVAETINDVQDNTEVSENSVNE